MKQLITKSDGVTPIKSKLHALQKLDKLGIDRDLLIEENGQFYYQVIPTIEEEKTDLCCNEEKENIDCHAIARNDGKIEKLKAENTPKSISWETDVFNADNQRTKLYIPGTDVEAVVNQLNALFIHTLQFNKII